MTPTLKVYGVSDPVSTKGPDEQDNILTRKLEESLKPFNVFESESDLRHRMEVLKKICSLFKEWIKKVTISKNIPEESAEIVGGKVCTFGSFRLGVNSQGGDIDTLCIAPRHIDREDFFKSFYEFLKKQNEVKKIMAVEDTFVPVIKTEFDGIELDMVFARLSLPTITDSLDLKDDNILRNLDIKCIRSLNGCRVTDEILNLVPNVDTFRLMLRTIKLWAKKNGIYSNALGFLGGVSWAMLAARVCQLYPNAAASVLVNRFFFVYSKYWQWPQPVLLKPMPSVEEQPQFGYVVWDPRINPYDRQHLMPIITPAYPQQNSAYNVTNSTRKIMTAEIQRGLEICEQINLGKAEWSALFEPQNFFLKYKHFIVLIITSPTKEYVEMVRLVESKIRFLIASLERNKYINIAHINPKGYEQIKENKETQTQSYSTLWFVGLEFINNRESVDINLTESIQEFRDTVFKQAQKIQIYKPEILMEAQHVKRKDLKKFLPSLASLLKADSQKSSSKLSRSESVTTITDTLNASNISIPPQSPANEDKLKSNISKTALLRNESNDSFISSPNPYILLDTVQTSNNETIILQAEHKIETGSSESSNDLTSLVKQEDESNVYMNGTSYINENLDNVNNNPPPSTSPPTQIVNPTNGTSKSALKRPHSPTTNQSADTSIAKKANIDDELLDTIPTHHDISNRNTITIKSSIHVNLKK